MGEMSDALDNRGLDVACPERSKSSVLALARFLIGVYTIVDYYLY